MAKLSFPTSREVACPLLVDEQQLCALDAIVDQHWDSLLEHREREIDAATATAIQDRLDRGLLKENQVEDQKERIRQERIRYSSRLRTEKRSTTLYLSQGKEIQAVRFSEAMSQPLGQDEVVVGFSAFIAVGSIEARIRLGERFITSLSIEVEPNEIEVAQEFFGALSNWASAIEAPKWQQKWAKLGTLIASFLVFWLVAGFLFIPLSNWGDSGKNANIAEARKLLAEGVTQNNALRALSLVLGIEADYAPAGQTLSLGIRYWSYFGIGTLILLCAVIRPAVCIGLWKGRSHLGRWRTWLTSITYTIPILLAGSVLLPWLLHWLKLGPPN